LPSVQIRLGRRDEFRGPFLARFRFAALGFGLVGLALAALISSTLSRRALSRLDAVGGEIAGLRADGSASPLPMTDLPGELSPIVERLNALLDRISESVRRERGLSADIAHELRTPIAALKTNFEVTLQRERDPAAYRESLRMALVVLQRSERTILRLLELHRMEAGNLDLATESFDLVQCVQEELRMQQAAIESKQLRLELAMPPQLVLRSEPTLWRLIVSNLLDNMVSYAAADRAVQVRLQTNSPRLEFECRNFGSDVDTAGARRMTERFARADASRDPSGNHVGLGLTMVRQACAMLDLELWIAVEAGGEFCVRVSGDMPRAA
jgi:signal transduction histidine kinase